METVVVDVVAEVVLLVAVLEAAAVDVLVEAVLLVVAVEVAVLDAVVEVVLLVAVGAVVFDVVAGVLPVEVLATPVLAVVAEVFCVVAGAGVEVCGPSVCANRNAAETKMQISTMIERFIIHPLKEISGVSYQDAASISRTAMD